eukprot:1161762-Pelagomonas_calceolata.AAC.4
MRASRAAFLFARRHGSIVHSFLFCSTEVALAHGDHNNWTEESKAAEAVRKEAWQEAGCLKVNQSFCWTAAEVHRKCKLPQ